MRQVAPFAGTKGVGEVASGGGRRATGLHVAAAPLEAAHDGGVRLRRGEQSAAGWRVRGEHRAQQLPRLRERLGRKQRSRLPKRPPKRPACFGPSEPQRRAPSTKLPFRESGRRSWPPLLGRCLRHSYAPRALPFGSPHRPRPPPPPAACTLRTAPSSASAVVRPRPSASKTPGFERAPRLTRRHPTRAVPQTRRPLVGATGPSACAPR